MRKGRPRSLLTLLGACCRAMVIGCLSLVVVMPICPAPALSDLEGKRASQLESVLVTSMTEGVNVTVTADGRIDAYDAFTLDNPPRIVFDLFGLKSQQRGLQTFATGSKHVKAVRYYGHPDKVRLVLETTPSYLSFTAEPQADGLEIMVSRVEPSPVPEAEETPTLPAITGDNPD